MDGTDHKICRWTVEIDVGDLACRIGQGNSFFLY